MEIKKKYDIVYIPNEKEKEKKKKTAKRLT